MTNWGSRVIREANLVIAKAKSGLVRVATQTSSPTTLWASLVVSKLWFGGSSLVSGSARSLGSFFSTKVELQDFEWASPGGSSFGSSTIGFHLWRSLLPKIGHQRLHRSPQGLKFPTWLEWLWWEHPKLPVRQVEGDHPHRSKESHKTAQLEFRRKVLVDVGESSTCLAQWSFDPRKENCHLPCAPPFAGLQSLDGRPKVEGFLDSHKGPSGPPSIHQVWPIRPWPAKVAAWWWRPSKVHSPPYPSFHWPPTSSEHWGRRYVCRKLDRTMNAEMLCWPQLSRPLLRLHLQISQPHSFQRSFHRPPIEPSFFQPCMLVMAWLSTPSLKAKFQLDLQRLAVELVDDQWGAKPSWPRRVRPAPFGWVRSILGCCVALHAEQQFVFGEFRQPWDRRSSPSGLQLRPKSGRKQSLHHPLQPSFHFQWPFSTPSTDLPSLFLLSFLFPSPLLLLVVAEHHLSCWSDSTKPFLWSFFWLRLEPTHPLSRSSPHPLVGQPSCAWPFVSMRSFHPPFESNAHDGPMMAQCTRHAPELEGVLWPSKIFSWWAPESWSLEERPASPPVWVEVAHPHFVQQEAKERKERQQHEELAELLPWSIELKLQLGHWIEADLRHYKCEGSFLKDTTFPGTQSKILPHGRCGSGSRRIHHFVDGGTSPQWPSGHHVDSLMAKGCTV